ncbi:transient receptor potential cation channel subfamily V member 1 [Rhinichthys klamathensis goyatoka]|uniref:transient receptor potential cation channel subfamily V member 1 n=1 Tax=Rhinichthys klamathensis goyatoka TaxID=3034132 RepID=UPI0024B4BD48|nr:transient receptor potential cation channel subfamily V member 1 [Rhinichthys klamathensis goyatoka]XP_056126072.1 transient receptor potential cation channel subfamily V member 1 [Rhinichthys klamathensis goyatoka]
MSKPKDSSTSSFTLETDDQTEEERSKAKQMKKGALKDKRPMDSNYLDDIHEPTTTIKFNLNFDRGIRNVKEEPAQQDSGRFTIKSLFEAVSSGEVSKLQGLHQYLHKNMKRLTDSQYKSNGKTALLKALLNLRKGENDTIEHLLDIAEKLGDLKNLVNAAYTDSFYKGQTALHVAIERRSAKFVQMLVKKGADVHAKACGKFFQPNQEMCFYFGELPLSLAACTNQPDIVDFLMDNPYQAVDVRERDSHGNMVLHALVSIADNSPENTEFVIAMYDHILIKAYQLHPKIKLEEIENNKGLTPIQLAAKTGKLRLFKHIVQREFKGCRHLSRKITEWAYGPVCSSLYDLASLDTYEKNSSLEIIVYGSEIPNRHEMLHIEPLNRLIEEKWDRFAQRMFMFKFIVYIIYLFIFTAVAYNREEGIDHRNNQSSNPPFHYEKDTQGYLLQTGQIITLSGALYFFIRGLIDMLRKRPRFQSLVIDGYSDQLFFLQAMLLLVCAVLYCFGQDEFLAFLVLSLALSWVNLLYFSRGSKHMGIYSIMIQKMILGEIRRFLVVYMVFLIGFSAAVVTLLDNKTTKSRSLFEASNGNEDCMKPTYKDIYFTTLELFKFTIGMGDLEFTEDYKYKEVFYVLLILYIVMTYILMLNMLIALMNQSVEEMSVESTSIWKLQRAITILDMEWILPHCLKTKLRSGEEKDLGGGQEPDRRWCFSVEEVNWNQWNRNMGIINEDPGTCTSLPSTTKPQREPSQRGLLQTLSKRWTQRPPRRDVQELDPLAEASTSV